MVNSGNCKLIDYFNHKKNWFAKGQYTETYQAQNNDILLNEYLVEKLISFKNSF